MSTYKLKSIAQRSTMLVAAAALVVATFAPAIAYADALNPLTERSLLLSSSAPGWQDTDGSGYSFANPNPGAASSGGTIPGHYAPAGSGANGMKTGETFSFKISTTADATNPLKAFTLQYCQEAAGHCKAPGDNSGNANTLDDDNTTARTPDRKTNAAAIAAGDKTSDLDVNIASAIGGTDYKIIVGGTEIPSYTGWALTATNEEDTQWHDTVGTNGLTGTRNYITLASSAGITNAPANTEIKIIFIASETKYITNPGSGSFFVKMNTYSSDTVQINQTNDPTPNVTSDQTVIDGGVTVANVMADSIHITTKVLETMQFSVGTHNPDTDTRATYQEHAPCEVIGTPNGNRLELGNMNAEFSLQTDRGYDVSSYWRLSSNSSGGASVYYSGETLTNTVGDFITPMPTTKTTSVPGSEQFGLAFYLNQNAAAPYLSAGDTIGSGFQAGITAQPLVYRAPGFYVLDPETNYNNGAGLLGKTGTNPETATAQFAFDRNSLTNPVLIADNTTSGEVLTCETGKMRYVANIAADTPAGVYTTKINYLAAPQY